MYFLIITGLIVALLIASVLLYRCVMIIDELNTKLRRTNGRIDLIAETLEEFYDEQFMPIEKHYNEHFSSN